MTATPDPPPAIDGPGAPPPDEQERPLLEATGTWWDEVLPVYAAMAIPGPLRRGYTAPEVDLMEIPVVGALMRVGPRVASAEEEAHDMLRQRTEWEAAAADARARGLPIPPPPEW